MPTLVVGMYGNTGKHDMPTTSVSMAPIGNHFPQQELMDTTGHRSNVALQSYWGAVIPSSRLIARSTATWDFGDIETMNRALLAVLITAPFVVFAMGCKRERLVEMAKESADRQAEQNNDFQRSESYR